MEINKEQELSPELVEKIMEKVYDIDAKGIAFHILRNELRDQEKPGDLESFMQNGIVSSTESRAGRTETNKTSSQQVREATAVTIKQYGQLVDRICFNIVGRMGDISPKSGHGTEIEQSIWVKLLREGGVGIVFDLGEYSETGERKEIQGRRVIPRKKYVNESYAEYGEDYSEATIKRWPRPSSDMGFIVNDRIPPRAFRGLILKTATNHSATKDFEAGKIWPARLEKVVSIMLKIDREHPERVVPIYSQSGDLLWPKKMSYQEVRQMVAENEDHEKQ